MEINSPTASKKPSKRANLVAAFVLLSIVGLVFFFAFKNGESSAASNTTATSQKSSNSAQSTIDAIAAWEIKYGSITTTFTNDFDKFSNDTNNVSAADADCKQLQADVKTAQSYPAIPDPTTEQHWSSALSDYSSATQDCTQGIENNDANQISQATNEFQQGNTEITATTTAINHLIGQ